MELTPFDTITVVDALSQEREPTFLHSMLFGARRKSNDRYIAIKREKRGKQLAPFVAYEKHGKRLDPQDKDVIVFKPELLAPVLHLDPAESLSVIARGSSPNERYRSQQMENVRELDRTHARREELMIAQLITKGKIIINGDGLGPAKDINLWEGLSAAQQPFTDVGATLATNYWTGNTADPLRDLRAAIKAMRDGGGAAPRYAIMGTAAAEAFIANAKVQSALDLRNADYGRLGFEALPDGAVWEGRVFGLDIFSYAESYVDRTVTTTSETYAAVDVIPGNYVILGSRNLGFFMDSMIPFIENGRVEGMTDDPRSYDEYGLEAGNPIICQRMRGAYAPIIPNLNSARALKVLAS